MRLGWYVVVTPLGVTNGPALASRTGVTRVGRFAAAAAAAAMASEPLWFCEGFEAVEEERGRVPVAAPAEAAGVAGRLRVEAVIGEGGRRAAVEDAEPLAPARKGEAGRRSADGGAAAAALPEVAEGGGAAAVADFRTVVWTVAGTLLLLLPFVGVALRRVGVPKRLEEAEAVLFPPPPITCWGAA